MDPSVAIFGAQTIEAYLKRALNLAETEAYIATTFGTVALLLSILGLYGVMSYSVAQRTREVGIRMALGARPGHVLRLVLRQTCWLSAIGVAAGTLLGFGLAQAVASMLYEISAHDARVFLITPLVLIAVTLLAASAGVGSDPSGSAERAAPRIVHRRAVGGGASVSHREHVIGLPFDSKSQCARRQLRRSVGPRRRKSELVENHC